MKIENLFNMSVPKKRRTKSSVGKRRSHDSLKKIKLSLCPKCKKSIIAHTACGNCGTYKGRQILKVETEKKHTNKKEKKENNN